MQIAKSYFEESNLETFAVVPSIHEQPKVGALAEPLAAGLGAALETGDLVYVPSYSSIAEVKQRSDKELKVSKQLARLAKGLGSRFTSRQNLEKSKGEVRTKHSTSKWFGVGASEWVPQP